MINWEETTLGEVLGSEGGFIRTGPFGSQLHQRDYVDEASGAVPVVMPKDMANGRIDRASISFIAPETAARLSVHLLEAGDVVVARRGDVGRTAWIAEDDLPALCGTGSMRIHPGSSRLLPGYLRYLLRSPKVADFLTGHAVGATMPNLNADIVASLPIRIPPPDYQRGAAHILKSFDDLIENNRRRIHLIDEMASAFYREWFVHLRFPGYESAKTSSSELGPMPEGWQVTRLADVTTVNRASRVPRAGEKVIYLDISCLGDRSIDVPTAIDGGDAPGRARRVVAPGDVLWSTVRPNRRAHALLVDPRPECIASTGLAVLSPGGVPSSFLFEAVSTRAFSDYLVTKESGAAYPAVRPADFEAAQLMVPPPELLQQFDEAVEPLQRTAWKFREQSRALSEIRDLALPRLVSGQIDLPTLELKPASEATA